MVTKKRYKFLPLLIFTVISLLFSLPNLLGYLKSNSERQFIQNAYFWDRWDVNVYVSVIKYSQDNPWKYENLYDHLSYGTQTIIYPFYTSLGSIFRFIDPYKIYSLCVFVFSFLLLLSIYWFYTSITPNPRTALLSTTLSSFAGGFGFLSVRSYDMSSTPFVLANVFQRPHSALALSFYLLSLMYLAKYLKDFSKHHILQSTALSFFSIIIYPYLLVSYLLIFTLTAFFYRQKMIERNGPAAFIKLFYYIPFLILLSGLYSAYLLKAKGLGAVINPALPFNHPLLVALGLGMFLVTALLQIRMFKNDISFTLTYTWIFVHLFIAFLPLGFARYFFLGIFIPFSYLAVKYYYDHKNSLTGHFALPFFLLCSLSVISILTYKILNIGGERFYWFENDIRAIRFLRDNLKTESIVLSTYPFSNFIPPLTSSRVYFGHYYQTPEAKIKIENSTRFFSGKMSEAEASAFLAENNIDTVVWKDEEYRWNSFPEPDKPNYSFLKEEFSNEGYSIYTWR